MAASLALGEGERALLAIEYGDAAFRAGKRDAARVAFLDAVDLARPLVAGGHGDGPRLLGRAAFGMGDIWGVAGRVDADVVRVLEEAVEAQSGDSILHARLLARLAVGYYWGGDSERRTELSRSAREMARRIGDEQTLAYVLDAAHYALWSPDNVDERLELANEIAGIGGGGSEVTGSAAGVFWRIIDALELGDLGSVDRDIQTYGRVSEETRQPHYRWYAAVARAMRSMLAGRLDEAEALALEAFSIGAEAQGENATHFLGVQMLELARLRGDFTTVEGPVEEFVARFPAIPAWRATLAYVRACQGDHEAARRQLRVLAEADLRKIPRDTAYLVAGALTAEACHRLRERDLAATVYEMLEPFAHHNVVVGNAAACMGSVSYYLGLLAHTLDRADTAREHYTAALRMHEALDSPPYVAMARAASAAVAVETNAPDEAQTLLEQATADAKRIKMALLEARCAEIAAQLEAVRTAAGPDPSTQPAEAPAAVVRGAEDTAGADVHLFRREGEYWTLAFAGAPVRVRQSRGLEYLSVLLAAPNREVHALELVQSVSGGAANGAATRSAAELARTEAAHSDAAGDAGEMLDERALAEYRERLADLESELAEAESFNDTGRQQTLAAEIEFLKREVARAVGLGGRRRKAGSAAERARVSVTRAIKTALARVTDAEPQLGRHLAATVKTGTFCSYTPDPRAPVDWQL